VSAATVDQAKSGPPLYLTASQVAELLQVSVKSVYRIAAENASMPVLRLAHGGSVRFHRERLMRWLDAHEQGRHRRSA
jgi:excisionase family DNA binding protein